MGPTGQEERLRVRVRTDSGGRANVETGVPVLDHLLSVLASYASFDLALVVAPGAGGSSVGAAGRALGEELSGLLRGAARGYGSATLPADEALAHVALEVSERALLVSNVDFSEQRLGGLGTDLVGEFLGALVAGAGLTLHVRLIDGDEAQHVLEAMFKALGVALAQASEPRPAAGP